MPSWEFERGGKVLRVAPKGRLVASAAEFEISAACAGLGIIYTFEDFLTPALRARKLVPFLEEWWQGFAGPYLYYPSRRLMPAPLRAFVDFVKARPAGASYPGHDGAAVNAGGPPLTVRGAASLRGAGSYRL